MNITQPGLYPGLSNADYHAQSDWVSSSALKALLPEHYKPATESSDALLFGSLFHTLVLEPDILDDFPDQEGIALLDAKTIGVKADGNPADNPTATKAWKDAVAEVEKSGRRVVTLTEWGAMLERAEAMAEAVRQHDTATELLQRRGGQVEESAFAVVDGVPCRARFDKRIPGVVIDLKSSKAKPGKQSIARTVIDYGYDLSAAHYLAVADALDLQADAFALIFVSNVAPHFVTVADLDAAFLERGYALRAQAIARHLNPAGDAYEGATGFLTLDCPRWAEDVA